MPNIIIGLGGTGTKVVRRIRNRWQDTGLPSATSLAVIDARSRDPENGPIDDAVFVKNSVQPLTTQYALYRDQVASWWPPQVTASPEIDFSDGCGAARVNGWFFASRFSEGIERTLRTAARSITAKTPHGGAVDASRFNVYLVGSLGNGTGSGTFMAVGAMAKALLANYGVDSVKVYGIFISASVTRKDHIGNILHDRIGANGVAALLELQYEFNRGDESADLRPRAPFVFAATDGVTVFRPGANADDMQAVPIDQVFLLDEYDRRGSSTDYHSLINMASSGIALMVEGADADSRLLDAFVHRDPSRRFGSFGAVRMRVPATEILDWAVTTRTAGAAAAAASSDEQTWRGLLADRTLDGKVVLPPEKATIRSSVQFFIQHLLRIRETGDGGGNEYNQLFDLFSEEDKALQKQLTGHLEGLDGLTDEKEIVGRATAVTNFVKRNTGQLAGEREQALLGERGGLWARRPRNPEEVEPGEAGTKWLLDRRVRQMAEAGAFGLLMAWLEELKKQVEANRASVTTHERDRWVTGKQPNVDLDSALKKIHADADSFWSRFVRDRLKANVGTLHDDARAYFEFRLGEAKVLAVEQFYDVLAAYVDDLRRGAETAAARVRDPRIQGLERKGREQAERLDELLTQRSNSEGFKAELLIGGDMAMREALLSELSETPDVRYPAVLGAMAGDNLAFFFAALGNDVSLFDEAAVPTLQDTVTLVDGYRKRLRQETLHRLSPLVAARTAIDRLLETEARGVLEHYFKHQYVERDAIDPRARAQAIGKLRDGAGVAATSIQRLDWDVDLAAAMDKGIDLYIAGKLASALQYGEAQWNIYDAHQDQMRLVFRSAFVSYPGSARRVAVAAEQFTKLGLGGEGFNGLKAQRDDLADPRIIDILIIEVGADFKLLKMTEDRPLYKRVMTEDRGFSPHTTRQYHEMGKRYLQETESSQSHGAGLLALAERCGLVTSDRQGNYATAQTIQPYDPSASARSFTGGYTLGRGLVKVAEWLGGQVADAQYLSACLKHQLDGLLREEAIGTPGSPGVGWDGVSRAVSEFASELRKKGGQSLDPDWARTVDQQATALEIMATDLLRLQGSERPALLR